MVHRHKVSCRKGFQTSSGNGNGSEIEMEHWAKIG